MFPSLTLNHSLRQSRCIDESEIARIAFVHFTLFFFLLFFFFEWTESTLTVHYKPFRRCVGVGGAQTECQSAALADESQTWI